MAPKKHNTEVFPQTRVELDGHRLAFYDKITGDEILGIELDSGVVEMLTLLVTNINAAENELTINLYDNEGVSKFVILDSAGTSVFTIDSNGAVSDVTSIQATSLATPIATHTIAENVSGDLQVTVVGNKDGIIKLGDDAGAQKLSIRDSTNAEKFSFPSAGPMGGPVAQLHAITYACAAAPPDITDLNTAAGAAANTFPDGYGFKLTDSTSSNQYVVFSDGTKWIHSAAYTEAV